MKLRIPVFYLLIFLFSGLISKSNAQNHLISLDSVKRVHVTLHWFDLGIGTGMDYGGIVGVKALFHPGIGYASVFVSGGYDIVGLAWGAGIAAQYPGADDIHKVRGVLKVMYGPNGVTKVTGASKYDKIFYGLIPGIGLQLRFGKNREDGLDLDLNIPLRSPAFFSQISAMKNDKSIEMLNDPMPVGFSIGYHHEF